MTIMKNLFKLHIRWVLKRKLTKEKLHDKKITDINYKITIYNSSVMKYHANVF